MITRKLSFKNINGTYEVYVNSKYTFIQGDSATGKSTMLRDAWDKNHTSKDCVNAASIEALEALIELQRTFVIFIDEDVFNHISKDTLSNMHTSCHCFVIVSRVVPSNIPLNYKDMYYLAIDSKEKSKHVATPIYSDYSKLIRNVKYVCEDSGSGYQYYVYHLNNVISAYGNSNIKNLVDNYTTVIADGAAFGGYIEDLKDVCDLYLPISFEYLVCNNMHPKDQRCSDPVSNWDISKYASLEQYYTALLYEFTVNFGQPYTKSKCPDYILNMDLLGE